MLFFFFNVDDIVDEVELVQNRTVNRVNTIWNRRTMPPGNPIDTRNSMIYGDMDILNASADRTIVTRPNSSNVRVQLVNEYAIDQYLEYIRHSSQ